MHYEDDLYASLGYLFSSDLHSDNGDDGSNNATELERSSIGEGTPFHFIQQYVTAEEPAEQTRTNPSLDEQRFSIDMISSPPSEDFDSQIDAREDYEDFSQSQSQSMASLRHSVICSSVGSLLSGQYTYNTSNTNTDADDSNVQSEDPIVSAVTHMSSNHNTDADNESYSGDTILSSCPSAAPSATVNHVGSSAVDILSEQTENFVEDTNGHIQQTASMREENENSPPPSITSTVSTKSTNTNIPQPNYQSYLNIGRHLEQSSTTTTTINNKEATASFTRNTLQPLQIPTTIIARSSSSSNTNNDDTPSSDSSTAVPALRSSTTCSSSSSSSFNSTKTWYSDLTDQDWNIIRESAQQILKVMDQAEFTGSTIYTDNHNEGGGKKNRKVLPVQRPPSPPPSSDWVALDSKLDENGTGDIVVESQVVVLPSLPEEFTCPLCQSIIVGSIVLECGCAKSTFCIHCLETFQDGLDPTEEEDVDSKLKDMSRSNATSYSTKEQQSNLTSTPKHQCPSCTKIYTSAVPCHALDVAIFNYVRTLSTETAAMKKIRSNYYARLIVWQQEVIQRQELVARQKERRQQEILSSLIQEQEEALKMYREQNNNSYNSNCNENDWKKKSNGQKEGSNTAVKGGLGERMTEAMVFVAAAAVLAYKLFRK